MISVTSKYQNDTLINEQKRLSKTVYAMQYVNTVGIILSFFVLLSPMPYKYLYCIVIILIITSSTKIIKVISTNKFNKNSQQLCYEYIKHYQLTAQNETVVFISDNQNVKELINASGYKTLLCFVTDNFLEFIAKDFFKIKALKSKILFNQQYENALNQDFGKLRIPISIIDNYLQKPDKTTVLVVEDLSLQKIYRIIFNNDKAFDKFIAEHEYTFKTSKKTNA